MGDRRVRAYVGLGANLGDAAATLATAVRDLATLPGVRVRSVSRLYATAPWGVIDQPDFHNAVVALDVRGGDDPASAALALLGRLKMLERVAGRGTGRRWGPRVLDLDILLWSGGKFHSRLLSVPHPELARRSFVLRPLAAIAPGWRIGSLSMRHLNHRLARRAPRG